MAKPIHHSPSSAVAETASVGVSRGLLGAIAGGLIATAAMAAVAVLAVGIIGAVVGVVAPVASFAGAVSSFGGIAALTGLVATWVTPVGYTALALGGGAGAIGGVMKRSGRIHDEEIASQNVGNAHNLKLEQQMHEVRAQTAEQYTKVSYAQGVQDGQAAVMQQLQQAAMEQQVAMQQAAPEAAPATEKSFVQSEQMRRGEDGAKAELASHVDRVAQSKENASEHVMGA